MWKGGDTIENLRIANLIPGMRNATVVGTIGRLAKRSYSTEKSSGVLCATTLADESGIIRLAFWNEELAKLQGIGEGDVVQIVGVVRQGPFGLEVALGRFGNITLVKKKPVTRTPIAKLAEGDRTEIRAALVQIFENSPFYEVCPKCGKSLRDEGEGYRCAADGLVEPLYAMRLSGVLDDGTGNIRCVMFRQQAEQILGTGVEKAKDIVLRRGVPELLKNAKPGEYIFSGRVRRNAYFDRAEFIVSKIQEVSPLEEARAMLGN